jgi:hypothetical protein
VLANSHSDPKLNACPKMTDASRPVWQEQTVFLCDITVDVQKVVYDLEPDLRCLSEGSCLS